MYEAADHWGGKNPWGVPCFIVTHRTEEQAAGDKDVSIGGGADLIRQALGLGLIDNLSIVIATVILGGGKRLVDGLTQDIELKHQGVRQSQHATIIDYAVTRS